VIMRRSSPDSMTTEQLEREGRAHSRGLEQAKELSTQWSNTRRSPTPTCGLCRMEGMYPFFGVKRGDRCSRGCCCPSWPENGADRAVPT
jgi:hypothetical protein